MLVCEAVEPDGKSCRVCGKYHDLTAFYKGHGTYGRRNICGNCARLEVKAWAETNPKRRAATARKTFLKATYGITVEQFEEMWKSQNGLCASCEDPLRRGSGGAAVDHDHATGAVRALLCAPCNMSLGAQKEDPERIRKLARYAEAHRAA